jgi:hypothetical protein
MKEIGQLKELVLKLNEFKSEFKEEDEEFRSSSVRSSISPESRGSMAVPVLKKKVEPVEQKKEKKVAKGYDENKSNYNFVDSDYWSKDPLMPRPTDEWQLDEQFPQKAKYSNIEITMGKCPGYEPDVAMASSGFEYRLFNVFYNRSNQVQRTKLPVLRKANNQYFF